MAFTYFFRDRQSLETAVEWVIPTISGRSKIRIWDAGCAMGPETYSCAILLAEKLGKYAFKNVKILATDIDESNHFGKIIREGIYPEDQVKRIPQMILEKYFRKIPNTTSYQVDDYLRKCIEYRKHDLRKLEPISGGISLIVCKNVLLHLNYNERINIIKMFYRSLHIGGLIITEHTQKLPNELVNWFETPVRGIQLFRKITPKNSNKEHL